VKGVIAAGHEVTAEAGARILRAGGNAFDAALAAMFASTVPEAILSSVGGGGFLMSHPAGSANKKPILYDFFVDTPRVKRPDDELDFHGIHADFGPATQEFHIGVGSAATPGIVPGAYAVHEDLCTMSMAEILSPAIEAAREGVRVNAFQAYLYTIVEPILRASPAIEALFAPDGALLKENNIFRNVALSETYEALAREGAALFTTGEVGRAILDQSSSRGGYLTAADLDHYKVIKREPLIRSHGGMEIALNPAPAQGGALIAYGLGLIEEITRTKDVPIGIETLVKVMELTNEARARHGADLEAHLGRDIISGHIEQASKHRSSTRGTTHISVVDELGNAASLTLSNGEGCGHMVGDCGLMLNNMLGEEDLNPDGFHLWEPGQRLSTMMSPTIISGSQGELLALGSGGSNRIRTAILQVIHYFIDLGLDLDAAIHHPRLHLERDGVLSFEDLFDDATRQRIIGGSNRSHPWPEPNMFFGGVNSVERGPLGELLGVGDERRGGTAIILD